MRQDDKLRNRIQQKEEKSSDSGPPGPFSGISCPPSWLSREAIREMVQKKAAWVQEKLDWFEVNRLPCQEKEYTDGEKFLYLGKEYPPLTVLPVEGIKKAFASFSGSEITVLLPKSAPEELKPSLVKKAVWNFYSECAEKEVEKFLKAYAEILNIDIPAFKVKHQKKRWGSCSADNVLRINFQLMMAPPEQLEYVVVHEICHVKEKNHSVSSGTLSVNSCQAIRCTGKA